MFNSYRENTLKYDPEECTNCGMCSKVCPHGVFARGEKAAVLVDKEACMECGACLLNCPTVAIEVESGVGCAAAMIHAALTGGPESCDGGCGCGGSDAPGERGAEEPCTGGCENENK